MSEKKIVTHPRFERRGHRAQKTPEFSLPADAAPPKGGHQWIVWVRPDRRNSGWLCDALSEGSGGYIATGVDKKDAIAAGLSLVLTKNAELLILNTFEDEQ